MNFGYRQSIPELMDIESIEIEEFRETLADIDFINRWTMGHRGLVDFVTHAMRTFPGPLRILDLGCGSGSVLKSLKEISRSLGREDHLVGIDNNLNAVRLARESVSGLDIEIIHGDLFALESKKDFDLIVCSHFTHHLDDNEIVKLLNWLDQRAQRGWFINDLHRSRISYHFIKAFVHLLPICRQVRFDAPASVANSFRKGDWGNYLNKSKVRDQQIRISWHWPFRYGVSRSIQEISIEEFNGVN